MRRSAQLVPRWGRYGNRTRADGACGTRRPDRGDLRADPRGRALGTAARGLTRSIRGHRTSAGCSGSGDLNVNAVQSARAVASSLGLVSRDLRRTGAGVRVLGCRPLLPSGPCAYDPRPAYRARLRDLAANARGSLRVPPRVGRAGRSGGVHLPSRAECELTLFHTASGRSSGRNDDTPETRHKPPGGHHPRRLGTATRTPRRHRSHGQRRQRPPAPAAARHLPGKRGLAAARGLTQSCHRRLRRSPTVT